MDNPETAGDRRRAVPRRSSASIRIAELAFKSLVWFCAACVLAIVGFILTQLIAGSGLSLHRFGWRFFTGSDWDPVNGNFGAVPFIGFPNRFLPILIRPIRNIRPIRVLAFDFL